MKKILLILLSAAALITMAFKPPLGVVYPHYSTVKIEKADLPLFLEQQFLDRDNMLILDQIRNSPSGEHRRYAHYYKGAEVLFSGLNVHLYPNGQVLVQNYLDQVDQNLDPLDHEYCVRSSEGWLLVEKSYNSEIKRPRWEFRDELGRLIHQQEHYRYFGDTTVKARVFQVNPTNSARTTYGGSYRDNGDQNNDSLQAQLFQVNTHAVYRNDSFFLEHPFFEFKELSWPYLNDHYGQASDTFFYNRSEVRFESVNSFHHLVEYYNYLKLLGYDHLVKKVALDVHALGGADNSQFDPDAYTIEYGDGGVDDAEDTEVVLHEYVHSLSATASNTFPNSPQRNAMEEGNCDYLAKSYSRSINDFNSYKIFSWDGHNEFWNGFVLDSDEHYPEDVQNNKDGDRDMWSSTLMCIHDYIGREATDSLVLEHFEYQFASAIMPDMAEVLLHLDTVLFNQRYYAPIKECLVERGLAEYFVNIDEPQSLPSGLIKNSAAFSTGSGSLEISSPQGFELHLFNTQAQLLLDISGDHILLDPQDYSKGVYILYIRQNGVLYREKVLR